MLCYCSCKTMHELKILLTIVNTGLHIILYYGIHNHTAYTIILECPCQGKQRIDVLDLDTGGQ